VGPDHSEEPERLRAFPAAVFVYLLREAGQALDARALKQRLIDRGADPVAVDQAWKRAQPNLRRYRESPRHYRWRELTMTPDEALDRLVGHRPTPVERSALADIVRAALAERAALEARAQVAYRDAAQVRGAYERQLRVDAARTLAEVAMEVEELAAAGAGADVTVERIRALVAGFGLAPIGRSGEQTLFDAARHTPIGVPVPAGSEVLIIRPGYSWQAGDQDVLLARAQIAPV
jgi:hypothetical protein